MDTPLSKSTSFNVATVNAHQRSQPDIYVPKSFPEMDAEGKPIDPMWMFKPFELRYLDALHRGEDPEKAMRDSGMSQRHAHWLLKRKKARDYMGQLLRQKLAAEAWTQEKWMSEGTDVWEGKKEVKREQIEVWKELGARIAPRPEKSRDTDRPIININIDLAQKALKRQEVIEGEVIESKPSDRDIQGSVQKESSLPL